MMKFHASRFFTLIAGLFLSLAPLYADGIHPVVGGPVDPAFEHYVSSATIQQALRTLDPEMMTDVAIQLAEGERALHRPCKLLSAGRAMEMAVRVAEQHHDAAALDRLSQAARRFGNSALADKLAGLAQAAPEAARTNPINTLRNEVHKDDAVFAGHILDATRKASIMEDHHALASIHQAVQNDPNLQPETRAKLHGVIGNAMVRIPAPPKEVDETEQYKPAIPHSGSPIAVPGVSRVIVENPDTNDWNDDRYHPDHHHHHHAQPEPPYHSARLRAVLQRVPQGYRILSEDKHSPLHNMVRDNDIIIAMDGQPIRSVYDLEKYHRLTKISYVWRVDGTTIKSKHVFIP